MYKFSQRSKDRLKGVHPDLVMCVQQAMDKQIMDFSVVEGLRSQERQQDLFNKGFSKTLKSKHLRQSDGFGHAVDLYPYPINMAKVNNNDVREIARFSLLAGVVLSCAYDIGITVVWGGDWDSDGQTLDHSFFDAPHFQLMR